MSLCDRPPTEKGPAVTAGPWSLTGEEHAKSRRFGQFHPLIRGATLSTRNGHGGGPESQEPRRVVWTRRQCGRGLVAQAPSANSWADPKTMQSIRVMATAVSQSSKPIAIAGLTPSSAAMAPANRRDVADGKVRKGHLLQPVVRPHQWPSPGTGGPHGRCHRHHQ